MQMPGGSGECTLQMRNGRTRLSNRAENTNVSTNGGLPRSRFSEPDDARARARAVLRSAVSRDIASPYTGCSRQRRYSECYAGNASYVDSRDIALPRRPISSAYA